MLAHQRLRQRLAKLDLPGDFIGHQPGAAVILDLFDANLLAFFEHHPGLDRLTLHRIGHASHAHITYFGKGSDHFFDLARPDLEATGLDQVLLAVDNKQVAILIQVADIAGIHPAIPDHVRRFGRVLPIAHHDLWRPDDDLADLHRGQAALTGIQIGDV